MLSFTPVTENMSEWDRASHEEALSLEILMENVAREAFNTLLSAYPRLVKGSENLPISVLLCVGRGNNGADGLCLARLLQEFGAKVEVLLSRPSSSYSELCAKQLALVEKMGIPCIFQEDYFNPPFFYTKKAPDILVDALIGTGLTSCLRAEEQELIHKINTLFAQSFIFSLDIPSGLHSVQGHALPLAIEADMTVSFQSPKPTLLLPEAKKYVGTLVVRPIGILKKIQYENPAGFATLASRSPYLLEEGRVYPLYERSFSSFIQTEQKRTLQTIQYNYKEENILSQELTLKKSPPSVKPQHKGQAGHVLIWGGAMTGASLLASLGALRGGAALITVIGDTNLLQALACVQPEAMGIAKENSQAVERAFQRADIFVCGMGLGRSEENFRDFQDFLKYRERFSEKSCVWDADALYFLAEFPHSQQYIQNYDILTPHPAEAGRFLGLSSKEVQENRFASMESLKEKISAICLLKGAGSLVGARYTHKGKLSNSSCTEKVCTNEYIYSRDEKKNKHKPTFICPVDCSALAVGGSGDTLSGLIAAYNAKPFFRPEVVSYLEEFSPLYLLEEEQRSLAEKRKIQYECSYIATCYAVQCHAYAGLILESMPTFYGHTAQEIANAFPKARYLILNA